METQEWFEQYQHQLEKRGHEKGRVQALARLLERRLGRSLSNAEHKVLADRLEQLGEDRIDEVVLEFKAEALSAWLADPAAR